MQVDGFGTPDDSIINIHSDCTRAAIPEEAEHVRKVGSRLSAPCPHSLEGAAMHVLMLSAGGSEGTARPPQTGPLCI